MLTPSRPRRCGGTCAVLVLVAGFVVLSGCSLLPGREGDPGGWSVSGGDGEDVVLEIRNDNANDARIYLRWNGDRRRLGYVSAKSSQTFRTEWRAQDLRIEIDFLAGRGYVTERTVVSPGDRLMYRIPVAR